jgi:hypothetical protein
MIILIKYILKHKQTQVCISAPFNRQVGFFGSLRSNDARSARNFFKGLITAPLGVKFMRQFTR